MHAPFLFALFLALTMAVAAPAVAAQDACTQQDPCPWDVMVDSTGFVGDAEWNWTQGDWMALNVFNLDDAAHTVTLSGYDVQLQVPSLEDRAQVVQLTQAGRFQFADAPSGDAVQVLVVAGDVVDYESGLIDADGADVTSRGSPGVALGLLAVALLALARSRKA